MLRNDSSVCLIKSINPDAIIFAGRSFHKIKHMLNMGPVCVKSNNLHHATKHSKKPNLNLFFFPLASWNPFKCNQQKVKKNPSEICFSFGMSVGKAEMLTL